MLHRHKALLPSVCCRFDGDIRSSEGMKLVDEYHSQYVNALTALWNDKKEKYAKQRVSELQIVE